MHPAFWFNLMFDTVLLLSQTLMLLAIAAWLTTGVWDNIVHPANNEAFTAQVMSMQRMQEMYPDEFARVAHRAVSARLWQRMAFRLVVLAELAATLALWVGSGAMVLALLGNVPPDTARALGLLGAVLFTSVWAGFLIVGNYFCYWFCHEWAQNTHFQMTVWGLLTLILLAQGTV